MPERAAPTAFRRVLLSVVKPVLGIGLLMGVLWWASRQQFALAGLGLCQFFLAVACCLAIVALSGELLKLSLRSLDIEIGRRDTLWLTAVGGLGNALGGLPIGTGIKFGLLIKQFGMSTAAVFWTYFFYSVVNAAWMLLFGAAIAGVSGMPVLLSGLMALPFALLMLAVALLRGGTGIKLPATLLTLVRSPLLWRGMAVSAAIVLLMLASFAVLLFARTDLGEAGRALLSVTIAVPIGFLTGLPSLGGIQELLLGASGTLFRLSMAHGVQLGLVARGASLLATTTILAACLLWPRRKTSQPQ